VSMKAFCRFIADRMRVLPEGTISRGTPGSCGSRGVTLLELLVVLAIIALIATFAVPALFERLGESRTKAARIQIRELGNVLDMYRLDLGSYPAEAEGLDALVTAPPGAERWNGPYLRNPEALTDPWGRPYAYRLPGDHGAYDLYSLGSDGQEGGDGEAADITSW